MLHVLHIAVLTWVPQAEALDAVLARIYDAQDKTPTFIVLNPNLVNLVSGFRETGVLDEEDTKVPSRVRYRMSYRGGGYTQAWIGAGRCGYPRVGNAPKADIVCLTSRVVCRFLAMDLTAGPCQLGPLKAGEGSVLANSLPRITGDFAQRPQSFMFKAFVGRLAHVIASGVSSVVAPDVAVHPRLLAPFAERIVVPVVAFRDHDDFTPFTEVGAVPTLSLASLALPHERCFGCRETDSSTWRRLPMSCGVCWASTKRRRLCPALTTSETTPMLRKLFTRCAVPDCALTVLRRNHRADPGIVRTVTAIGLGVRSGRRRTLRS